MSRELKKLSIGIGKAATAPMTTQFQLPDKKAVVFWPIGTGDSTTLVLEPKKTIMQIDIRHLEKAEDPNEPEWPIIDHLVRTLPRTANGRPYLALFVLTHPDKDHVQGFAELLRRVDIGEIWHTPRIFRDQANQEALCEDAKAFRREAHRRARAIIARPNFIVSGDRLRVIGHDDVLNDPKYVGLPASCKSRPADIICTVDGRDLSGQFAAFIHAPFKDDQAKSRNNTSLAMNVALKDNNKWGQFFFFGDREYPTIKRIFERTEQTLNTPRDNTAFLFWDVMLCSHHCSKCVMYWQGEGDTAVRFKKDIMDFFAKYSRNGMGTIVSSSHSKFTDGEGDNPPHKRARERYEEIVKPKRFVCTHEYPSKSNPVPMVFTVEANGVTLLDRRPAQIASPLVAAIAGARGAAPPPSVQIGFGQHK